MSDSSNINNSNKAADRLPQATTRRNLIQVAGAAIASASTLSISDLVNLDAASAAAFKYSGTESGERRLFVVQSRYLLYTIYDMRSSIGTCGGIGITAVRISKYKYQVVLLIKIKIYGVKDYLQNCEIVLLSLTTSGKLQPPS